jgi:hypothetical protein
MRAFLTALTALATIGCSQPAYEYTGYKPHEHFPLDGERYWTYQNPSEDHLLDVTIDSRELVNEKNLNTLRYSNGSLDSVMYWIKWSSDSTNGIQIHGYMAEDIATDPDEGEDDTGAPADDAVVGSWVNYDKPLSIARYQMTPGESIESDGNGTTYTATFASVETCPNNWADTDWDCLKFVIDSEESEPPPFVGTWHWATEFGTSLFLPKGAENPWILTDFEWFAD